jgi:hypothetical protein
MEKEFVPYEQALALKELGFDEPCLCFYNTSDNNRLAIHAQFDSYNLNMTNNTNTPNRSSHGGNLVTISAPTFSQAFRWFRENHDLHVQIRKENYFQQTRYEYYHYDISKGEENDITNQEDLYHSILNESHQDIPGNYLNDEKFSKLIFRKEFAFKTYEETELTSLKSLIKIVKNN